jgi:glycosyltransferase involved in cell wall biosynthesis
MAQAKQQQPEDRGVDRIRVLFLIGGLGPGGAERQARLLLTRLPDAGVSVRLGCFGGYPSELDLVSAAGVPIDDLSDVLGRRWPIRALLRIREIARLHRIRIVQTYLSSFDILAPFIRLVVPGVRVITSRRAVDEIVPARDLRLLRLTGRFVHAIVANSKAVAESVQRLEGHRSPRLRVIQNGILLPPPLGDDERLRARRTYGVSEQDFVVAYAAHLRPGKGHHYLPEVVRTVVGRLPHARFLLAGETDVDETYSKTTRELRQAIEREGLNEHVAFLGPVSDMRSLFAASDVSLSLSDFEGMSNALLEAMAHEVPVIAVGSGGTNETITHGVEGWLVPQANPSAAVEILLRAAADPALCKRVGDAARRRVARDFSVERMVSEYVSLYQELV